MIQRAVTTLLAIGIVLFCAVRVSAQEVISLPSGGLHRIRTEDLDARLGGRFEALAVTLPPRSDVGVLFLDGKPLAANRILSREEINRLMLFSSEKAQIVSIGVTVLGEQPTTKNFKIRCINPTF